MKRLLIPPEKVSAVRICFHERARDYEDEIKLGGATDAQVRAWTDLAAFFRELVRQLDYSGDTTGGRL